MARRARSVVREILPDAKFRSITVSRLIIKIMERGKKRTAEGINLVAGVINVIFFLYFVSRRGQHGGKSAAQDSAPPVPHMKRAGGINTDKFYLYPFALPQLNITIGSTIL